MLVASLELSAIEYKYFQGDVTKFKKGTTHLYQVRGITVGRGGEKYVKKYVGQLVKMLCYIKKKKIVKIKSVEVLSKAKDKSNNLTVVELQKLYKSNRSFAIEKYRGKLLTLRATATSITVKDAWKYQIALHGTAGKILIYKTTLPEDLRKALFAMGNEKRGQRNIIFKAKWVSNQGDTLLFREVDEIK